MIEEWRPSPSFPDYEISSFARVRRLTTTTSTTAGKVLKASRHYSGYWQHGLGRQGRTCTVRLNRLVCEAFHGAAPSPAHHAAHRDDCKDNNTPDNRYWATRLENEADKSRNGRRRRGSRVSWAKLDEQKARAIVASNRAGSHPGELAAKYGVSEGLIRHVINGRNWSHATGISAP